MIETNKMEKKEPLLVIDPPNELKFRGPFTRPVTTVMTLTNPTNETILFKIKTTAPRKYCVRPNFGSLEPNSSINVTQSDYEKAIAEVQQLRIDESQLRQENMQLKEQLIRLKAELKERTANPQNAYSPPQIGQQQQVQIVYIAIAVSMAIFGMVLGKLLL